MILKPITSEKAVKLIDLENTIMFEVERKFSRTEIKNVVEKIFNVKVDKVRTLIRQNKKYAYVRFASSNPAIDLATKLGMI